MLKPKTLEDIRFIVEERLEETIHLEFKRKLPDAGKNVDIAKDIIAMANTEGGVIIYGIDEDNVGRAEKEMPFKVGKSSERILAVARNSVDEPLEVTPRTIMLDGELGYLVVEVPISKRAPHFSKGLALKRTLKGNSGATRRELGELFVRSSGFLEEYGLGSPGRVCFIGLTERHLESNRRGQLKTKMKEYLVYENDGNAPVYNVKWSWHNNDGPGVLHNPFPITKLPSGATGRMLCMPTLATKSITFELETWWEDKDGKTYKEVWPISW